MEKIAIRVRRRPNKEVIRRKKVFLDENEALKYVKSIIPTLNENEYIYVKYLSDTYHNGYGEIEKDVTNDELEYALYTFRRWIRYR